MTELISYESIRSIQRSERDEKLQSLPKDFFISIRSWMDRKQNQKDNLSIIELESAKKLIEDIVVIAYNIVEFLVFICLGGFQRVYKTHINFINDKDESGY